MRLFQTLFIYAAFIIIMVLCSRTSINNQKLYLRAHPNSLAPFWTGEMIFLVLFFSLLAGLRYDVGTDHLFYLEAYLDGGNDRLEFLFSELSGLYRTLGVHPIFYFFTLSLIQISFFILAFRENRFVLPFLAVFLFTNSLYGSWINTIRQDIAICIWIYAIQFILNKDWKRYLICCLICFGFHRSSFIFVFFYPLFCTGKDFFSSTKIQFALIIAALFIRHSFGGLLNSLESMIQVYMNSMSIITGSETLYDSYTVEGSVDQMINNADSVTQTGLAFFFRCFIYMVIVIYSPKMKEYYHSKRFTLYYNCFFIALLVTLMLPPGAFNLARPFQCFIPFLTIMLAYFCFYLINQRRQKVSLVNEGRIVVMKSTNMITSRKRDYYVGVLIVIMFIAMFSGSIVVSSFSNGYIGYQLYFQR